MQTKRKPARPKERDITRFMSPQGAPRGLLYLVALWKIAGKPMSGYQLMQDIEAKTEGAWRPGPGAIYPILKRLEAEGYVKASKAERGQGKATYKITAAGEKRIASLRNALKSSGERWAMMRSIFSDIMEPEDLAKFVIQSPANHFQFVHELIRSNGQRMSHEDKLYLLREYNLLIEREHKWAERALVELTDGETAKAIAGGAPI